MEAKVLIFFFYNDVTIHKYFRKTYAATAGTSYPDLIVSEPAETASVKSNRGSFLSLASSSNASLNS